MCVWQPENLILASHESDAAVKLTDFGLAVYAENTPTFYGVRRGVCAGM